MGIKERRQEEKEAIRRKIIDAASEIIGKEGYDRLSIRKIAARIDYSPGTIYQYFKDKADIVTTIVREEYAKILEQIRSIPVDLEHPERTIEVGLRAYIKQMLMTPEKFRAIVMNDIEEIQDCVNILSEGISKERASIVSLSKLVALCNAKGKSPQLDPELTAQILWTSTYGLVSRLIIEKDIPESQQEKLINQHFHILLHGLLH